MAHWNGSPLDETLIEYRKTTWLGTPQIHHNFLDFFHAEKNFLYEKIISNWNNTVFEEISGCNLGSMFQVR